MAKVAERGPAVRAEPSPSKGCILQSWPVESARSTVCASWYDLEKLPNGRIDHCRGFRSLVCFPARECDAIPRLNVEALGHGMELPL